MQRFTALGLAVMALVLTSCAAGGPSGELRDGWELMVAKEYAAARDHYEGMLAEYPDNPYAHLNLGVAYQRLGEPDLARQHYESAIAHGGNAQITEVADDTGVASETKTVAEQAQQNLQTLPN